jgi:Flp pilus assembly pilin Flp
VSKIRQFVDDVKAATYGVMPEREEGQTNVEYALILFLVAIVAAAVLLIMGGKIKDVLNSVNASL